MRERKLINQASSKNNVEKCTLGDNIHKKISNDRSLRLIKNYSNSIMKRPKYNLKVGKRFEDKFPKEDT